MNFNLDCARDILLFREKQPLGVEVRIQTLFETIPKYSQDEIEYACLKLKEADFLDVCTIKPTLATKRTTVFSVREITYQGHAFLDNVRNDSIWTEAKKKTKSTGTVALDIVSQVAASIISNKLGL